MTSVVSDDQLQRLLPVADLLIPGSERDRSASDILDDGRLLRRAVNSLPQMLPALITVLNEPAQEPEAWLRQLRAYNDDGFKAVTTVIAGAYFMSPEVRKALGYPGQVKNPPGLEEAIDDLDGDILDPVMERGPIYVPTPEA